MGGGGGWLHIKHKDSMSVVYIVYINRIRSDIELDLAVILIYRKSWVTFYPHYTYSNYKWGVWEAIF